MVDRWKLVSALTLKHCRIDKIIQWSDKAPRELKSIILLIRGLLNVHRAFFTSRLDYGFFFFFWSSRTLKKKKKRQELFFLFCLFLLFLARGFPLLLWASCSFRVSLLDSASLQFLSYSIFYLLSRHSKTAAEQLSDPVVILTPEYLPRLLLRRMKYCSRFPVNTFIPSVYAFTWSDSQEKNPSHP